MTDGTKINPKHYKLGNVDTIEMMRSVLTPEEFKGYLKGSIWKYVARAGRKEGEPAEDDYAKAAWFKERLGFYSKGDKNEL